VQYDPQEWRDGYDMSINVGIGNGDSMQQMQFLMGLSQTQGAIAASPFGQVLVDPEKVFNLQGRLIELAGFKNPEEFFKKPKTDPQTGEVIMPPPQPPIELLLKDKELQADVQKFQADSALKKELETFKVQSSERAKELEYQLQASNDQRDAEREALRAQYEQQIEVMKLELDKYKTDADNRTKIVVARMQHPEIELNDLEVDAETGEVKQKPDPIAPVMETLFGIVERLDQPKLVLRDESGKVVGVQHGQQVRPVIRDEAGRVVGVQ